MKLHFAFYPILGCLALFVPIPRAAIGGTGAGEVEVLKCDSDLKESSCPNCPPEMQLVNIECIEGKRFLGCTPNLWTCSLTPYVLCHQDGAGSACPEKKKKGQQ